MSKIFAVDFDGTLCFGKWPELGAPNIPLIKTLINKQRCDDKLILWTCHTGEALKNAVEWCRQKGLVFDAVNDNLPDIVKLYGSNSRKITFDYFIDDKNTLPDDIVREG